MIASTLDAALQTSELTLSADGLLTPGNSVASVQLSKQRQRILAVLISRHNQVVTYQDLLNTVWNGIVVEASTVQRNVSRLRANLTEAGLDDNLIQVVQGRGYRWTGSGPEQLLEKPATGTAAPPPASRFSKGRIAAIAALLAVAMGASSAVISSYRKHQAEKIYQQGISVWNRRDIASDGESLQLFRAVLRIDPAFVPAHVGAANALLFQASPAPGASDEIAEALRLDPTYGPAYTSRGFYRMVHQWDWDQALIDLLHGHQLAPENSTAAHWLSVHNMAQGKYAASVSYAQLAKSLEPESRPIARTYATALYLLGNHSEAIQKMDAIPSGDDAQTRRKQAVLHYLKGNLTERTTLLERMAGESGTIPRTQQEAYRMLCGNAMGGYEEAVCASITGDKERALTRLNEAVTRHEFQVFLMLAEPAFEALHADPRFNALLLRIGVHR